MISEELVPPKPNELDKNTIISFSIVLFAIFNFAESSSGFSKFMLGATNEFCIINTEYTISLAPAIQHSWPVIDFVELTNGLYSPKTSLIALASLASPAGVDVACALI